MFIHHCGGRIIYIYIYYMVQLYDYCYDVGHVYISIVTNSCVYEIWIVSYSLV